MKNIPIKLAEILFLYIFFAALFYLSATNVTLEQL